MIQKLLSLKNEKLEKQEYPKTIIDPLSLALEFYKEQSDDNYKRIIEGIQSEQITLLEKRQSYIDTKSGNTYIFSIMKIAMYFVWFMNLLILSTVTINQQSFLILIVFWQKVMLSTWKND